jgi:hypothetical protein
MTSELHLVLHEDHGAADHQLADQRHRLGGLLGAHPRGRLIEQQQGRIGGERDADLQMPLPGPR